MWTKKKEYLNEFQHIIHKSDSLAKWVFAIIKSSNRDMMQQKTSIPKSIQKYLEERYESNNCKFNFLNKYENIDYSGTVTIKDEKNADAYINLYNIVRDTYWFNQFNKYRNYDLIGIDGKFATYDYIDTLWNKKTKKESLLVFKKYVLEHPCLVQLCKNYKSLINDITVDWKIQFTYKITNNVNDKLKVVHMNSQRNSCQWKKDWVREWMYARWLYDFFNNGCIAPLIIYHEWKIVWRSAFRIFYDKDWKRYINLERIFWHWHLIDNLRAFCCELTKDLYRLNETLTLSEKFSITNTYKRNPRFDALKECWDFELTRCKDILRQPKRLRHPDIKQWYYQDSLIHTIWVLWSNKKTELIYDCINPSDEFALHIVNLKNVSSEKTKKTN